MRLDTLRESAERRLREAYAAADKAELTIQDLVRTLAGLTIIEAGRGKLVWDKVKRGYVVEYIDAQQ